LITSVSPSKIRVSIDVVNGGSSVIFTENFAIPIGIRALSDQYYPIIVEQNGLYIAGTFRVISADGHLEIGVGTPGAGPTLQPFANGGGGNNGWLAFTVTYQILND